MLKGFGVIILFVLSLGILFFIGNNMTNMNEIKTICGDGTFFGECSLTKPFYCDNGNLVENSRECGCNNLTMPKIDSCVSQLQTEPRELTLKYILRGKEGEINYTIYKGLVGYLDELPLSILYKTGETPERRDFKLKRINEEQQRELLLPLVVKIQDITPDRDDQFRIAVSLVQKIPFGLSNKTDKFLSENLTHQRYPYEVLYDMQGVCGEKSDLLVFLLKELGYGTSLFYYADENHEAVGVSCPVKESLLDSGYCFIETTGSSILTNNKIIYDNGVKLESTPEIIMISQGNALGGDLYEYEDAEKLIKIDDSVIKTGRLNPWQIYQKKMLTNKYDLEEYYDLR